MEGAERLESWRCSPRHTKGKLLEQPVVWGNLDCFPSSILEYFSPTSRWRHGLGDLVKNVLFS